MPLSLFHLGRYQEAERQFLYLKKKMPTEPLIYYWLSQVYEKLNRLNEAEEAIKKANDYSNKENIEYLNRWARILKLLKKDEQANQISNLALNISSGNIEK